MAFGTGHHSTTSLIIDQLLRLDFDGKSVIDMGTGTGILSILAAMRGAHPVTAIEIDEFAYLNAIENVKINGHSEIDVIHGDTNALQNAQPVDVFIANINRNVILNDIDKYTRSLKAGGIMLLSGFYVSDIPMIEKCANNFGLSRAGYSERENWTCLCLIKNV